MRDETRERYEAMTPAQLIAERDKLVDVATKGIARFSRRYRDTLFSRIGALSIAALAHNAKPTTPAAAWYVSAIDVLVDTSVLSALTQSKDDVGSS